MPNALIYDLNGPDDKDMFWGTATLVPLKRDGKPDTTRVLERVMTDETPHGTFAVRKMLDEKTKGWKYRRLVVLEPTTY